MIIQAMLIVLLLIFCIGATGMALTRHRPPSTHTKPPLHIRILFADHLRKQDY